MNRDSSTRWFAALAALIAFVLAAWMLGAVVPVSDAERVVLRVGLVALGLVAAAAVLWFLRPTATPLAAAPHPARDDALTALAAARARLPRGEFDARRLVLVAGIEGSCKTTVVGHSGADPELLAGDAPKGNDAPPATLAANVWAVRDGVLVEAGGPIFADAPRWKRVVRAIRPPRLGAVLGRREPPPRAVVLCVSCDLLYAGDGGAQLDTLAQLTRERLALAARELGVMLPVYVLFTKADRVPHFEPWVSPLTREETVSPLGATLPFDAIASEGGRASRAAATGSYAERLTPRLGDAFAQIVSSVAARRLDLLGRESQLDRRLAAYELPRELEKLAPPAIRFLVEICRPMQIGVSPQLRGFYFVGARPVVVSDAAPASASIALNHFAAPGAADATSVFSRMAVAAPVAPPALVASVSRRVPQWVFLDRFFPQVVFADEGAATTARGGVRVARLRRGLLGAGIAALLLVSLGIVRSALGNRALEARTTEAARAVTALPAVTVPAGMIAFPSADALQRLDALRGTLDSLRYYEATGVPMRLRFGLWHGGALLASGRRVWLDAYRQQLHTVAWNTLFDSLRALPDLPRPTDDYGHTYGMLKAYLVMTNEPARSTPDMLAPQLLASWARGQTLDADIMALARRQFEFYAAELPRGNPWPQPADQSVVQHTRTLLARFTGAEQIYQNMLAEANKAVPALNVASSVPLAPGVLAGQPDVPGAFTAQGWAFMKTAFANADRYFQGERWVVGDAITISVQDRARTIDELRAHYRREYVQRWRTFVRALSVVRSNGSRDASQKLSAIAGPQSPLLGELALVARNTAVDSAMAAAFQPVHAVTPPNLVGKYITDANQPYANALATLQGAVEQIANMPPSQDSISASALAQAGQQALGQAGQAKVAVHQIEQKFRIDTAAVQIGPAVAQLLEAPIDATEQVLRGVAASRAPVRRAAAAGPGGGAAAPTLAGTPVGGGEDINKLTAALNERGRALCSMMSPMLNKFPFTPEAQTDASLAEVTAMLAPGTGALWAFEHDRLDPLIEKQGTQWVMRPDARVALSGSFLTFFNRAAQASAALFGAGADPHVAFTAHAAVTPQMPEVILIHGTRVARFDRVAPEAQLVWPPASAREAKLVAKFSGRFRSSDRTVAEATGDWALFHLVSSGTVDAAGSTLHAVWNVKDESPVAVDFVIASGFPVLRRGWLGGMVCAPQVTR